jgi:hypothetical protein
MEQSPEKQLQELEEEYRRRRSEIEQAPTGSELPAERETMSKVVQESIQSHVPEFQAPANSPDAAVPLTDEQRAKVDEWVAMVFAKGLDQGIKAARDANEPAMLDAFHDALTGELHEQLVQQGKLKAI